MNIQVWNRASRRLETEKVYGDRMVKLLYGSGVGRTLTDQLLTRPWLSHAYGLYQSSKLSKHKIEPFVQDFQIPMQEYEEGPFATFNDFFIRKFRPGAREFVQDRSVMPAFAEARYLAWDRVTPEMSFPVKGSALTPAALLGSEERARDFKDGSLMIARLCPVDYHRYHYPASGRTLDAYTLGGRLHSVNPLALKFRSEIFRTNERRVAILETEDFGKLAYIEVGAMCVGKIVQTHPETQSFGRGQEKGYFLFGASTVILLGERGKWRPAPDLLEQTAAERESLVRLGEGIANRA